MKNGMVVALVVVAGIMAGCGTNNRALKNGELRDVLESQSDSTFIRTRGIGVAPDGAKGETKRKGLARNAALVAARYEMLEIIKGIKVQGGLTVGQLAQTDGTIKETADKIVAGSIEESCEFTKDGGAVVLLQIERSRVDELLARTEPYEVKN